MHTIAMTDDYTLVTLSASSGSGFEPDTQANRMLRRYGFVARNGNPCDLYRAAVLPGELKGKFVIKLSHDGERGSRAQFLLSEGSVEVIIDRGRVLDIQQEQAPSTLQKIKMEGAILSEWIFCCLRPADTSLATNNGNSLNGTSTPPLNLDESVFAPTVPIRTIVAAPTPVGAVVTESTSPAGSPLACEVKLLSIKRIRRFKEQPRKRFRKKALRELGECMLQEGQQHAITVLRVKDDPSADYELIDGERRWRAAELVGIKDLLAIVKDSREVPDVVTHHRKSLVANLCNEPHTKQEILEELLLQRRAGKSVLELARMCGRPVSWVYSYVTLENLVPDLRKLMNPLNSRTHQLTMQIGRILARAPAQKQMEIYDQIARIRSAKLKALKAEVLVSALVPAQRKYSKVPGDYVKDLVRLVPRMLADCTEANKAPQAAFKCLIEYRDIEASRELIQQLEETIEGLRSLQQRITDARKFAYS